MNYMKLVIHDLAYSGLDGHKPWTWLQRSVPETWGYLGPTEASCRPTPPPWLMRGDNAWHLLLVLAVSYILVCLVFALIR